MTERTAYLALDLGTSCGWAVVYDGVGEIRPRTVSGTWDCQRHGHETEAQQFRKFRSYLTETKQRLEKMGVRLRQVRYERVDFIASGNGVYSVHLWGAWWGHLLHWCDIHNIEPKPFAVSTIKKRLTGNGHAKKPLIDRAVRARGFSPYTTDEADALAIAIIQERT